MSSFKFKAYGGIRLVFKISLFPEISRRWTWEKRRETKFHKMVRLRGHSVAWTRNQLFDPYVQAIPIRFFKLQVFQLVFTGLPRVQLLCLLDLNPICRIEFHVLESAFTFQQFSTGMRFESTGENPEIRCVWDGARRRLWLHCDMTLKRALSIDFPQPTFAQFLLVDHFHPCWKKEGSRSKE